MQTRRQGQHAIAEASGILIQWEQGHRVTYDIFPEEGEVVCTVSFKQAEAPLLIARLIHWAEAEGRRFIIDGGVFLEITYSNDYDLQDPDDLASAA